MVQPLIPGFGSVIQERAVCTSQTSLPPRKISPTAGFYLQTLFSRKKLLVLAVESLALYSNRNTGEESKNEREDFNPQQRRRNGGDSGTDPHTANTAVGF